MFFSSLLKNNQTIMHLVKRKRLYLRLFILLLMATAATGRLVAETQIPTSQALAYHEQGRAIYNYRCYFCHGYSGDARTLTSTYVDPPPRNFQQTEINTLSRQQMLDAVSQGKAGTAMTGFSRLLNSQEIAAVVDFVRQEFMLNKQANSRYHSPENGWPDHQRYAPAFPFATGEIPLDTPWDELTARQSQGKRLFLGSCISCHDRARVSDEGEIWQKQSISYPRNNYSHTQIDSTSSASIYAQHDISPQTPKLSKSAQTGKKLWLDNCAFCHGADGSGQNWIGSFLEPPPRDLRQADFMSGMNRQTLHQRIANGLENTSMPAWKHVLQSQQIEQIISYISEAFYPLETNRE